MSATIVRGRVLVGRELREGGVIVEGGVIAAIVSADEARASTLPLLVEDEIEGQVVAPGFIDLQVNGAFGADAAEGADAIVRMSAELPKTGVTSFLPTLVSAERAQYAHLAMAIDDARRRSRGAEPLGYHLEGPWLATARRGAHRREAVDAASFDWLDEIPGAPVVRLVTLAPERDGALDAIRALVARGIAVSIGHTEARYDTAIAAFDAGATMATHLYNAMSPLHHRDPGAVGAILDDDRVVAGLIADGIHVHSAAARVAVRAKSPDRIALVTDAIAAAGMLPGDYSLGRQRVIVDPTSARLADGTLAGSVLTMDAAIRNVVAWRAASIPDALRMAGEIPARLLHLPDRGRIAVGLRADLTLLTPTLRVITTNSC